jgi:hypothetical protein
MSTVAVFFDVEKTFGGRARPDSSGIVQQMSILYTYGSLETRTII